jgi:hypothetical protein
LTDTCLSVQVTVSHSHWRTNKTIASLALSSRYAQLPPSLSRDQETTQCYLKCCCHNLVTVPYWQPGACSLLLEKLLNIRKISISWNVMTCIPLNLLPASCWSLAWFAIQPWRWRLHVDIERPVISNWLNVVIFKKIVLFIITAVRFSHFCVLKVRLQPCTTGIKTSSFTMTPSYSILPLSLIVEYLVYSVYLARHFQLHGWHVINILWRVWLIVGRIRIGNRIFCALTLTTTVRWSTHTKTYYDSQIFFSFSYLFTSPLVMASNGGRSPSSGFSNCSHASATVILG